MMIKFSMTALLGYCQAMMVGSVAFAGDFSPKFGREEARQLVVKAIGSQDNGISLEDAINAEGTPFFDFEGLGTSDGSYGFFAVNYWTGDVWALWGCQKLTSAALRKAQAEIRRTFPPEQRAQYRKLRKIKPECISGDD